MSCNKTLKSGDLPGAGEGRRQAPSQAGTGCVPRTIREWEENGASRDSPPKAHWDSQGRSPEDSGRCFELARQKFAETYFRCSVGWDGAGGRNRRSVCTELTLTWEREGRRRGADRRATDRKPGVGLTEPSGRERVGENRSANQRDISRVLFIPPRC